VLSALSRQDLDHVLEHTRQLWADLRGGRIFITGGTGFFGTWLLETFAWANEQLGLNAKAVVLSRDPGAFLDRAPHLRAKPGFEFVKGDVSSFDSPPGRFSHVIHAATAADFKLAEQDPIFMYDTIVGGTRRVLDFAASRGVGRILFTSSGAVYGPQPSELERIPETYAGAPDPLHPRASYGEGKRSAELLCAAYLRQHSGLQVQIARCFSFVGPHLPLDGTYAVGHFMRDGLAGRDLQVEGDGTPCRSYLYAADLALWLWTILFKGRSGYPYNVGSENALSVGELAREIARAFGCEVRFGSKPTPGLAPDRYVPATGRAREELGLEQRIGLHEALRRTIAFLRGSR
jgi:nucleoside-diphosphate-sugar epimerase